MIHMTLVRRETGPVARVTFTLPSTIWADTIYLVGEFNEWNETTHPFIQDRSGMWTLSVDLALNRTYVFAYLCDGQWLTDDHPDGWIWDADGRHVFLVITDEQHVRVPVPSGHRPFIPPELLPHEDGEFMHPQTGSML